MAVGSPDLPNLSINPVVRDLPEAMSITINELVAGLKKMGRDVTTLSLGEAFFDIPQMKFEDLDFLKSCHYSDSRGLFDLRRRFSSYYKTSYDADVDPSDEIIISAGSKVLIFMAILVAAEPGAEVLIHEPAWLSYPHQVSLTGAIPKFIPYGVEVADFEGFFNSRTRMVIICNPNNPAGRVYSETELRTLYQICRQKGVYLLVDEAYSDFVSEENFVSILSAVQSKEGVIAVNSISKNMGISGWRIGYAMSSQHFIFQMLKLNQHIITCAPTILLQYCNKYFDEIISSTLPQVRHVVSKRKRVVKMIENLGMQCLEGGATFYIFLSIANYPGNSEDLAFKLLMEDNIAVVPGSAYGSSTDRFVRISVGTESEDRIFSALQKISIELKVNTLDRANISRSISAVKRELTLNKFL